MMSTNAAEFSVRISSFSSGIAGSTGPSTKRGPAGSKPKLEYLCKPLRMFFSTCNSSNQFRTDLLFLKTSASLALQHSAVSSDKVVQNVASYHKMSPQTVSHQVEHIPSHAITRNTWSAMSILIASIAPIGQLSQAQPGELPHIHTVPGGEVVNKVIPVRDLGKVGEVVPVN